MKTLATTIKDNDLWQTYQQRKTADRMLFPTEGAQALNVSELELLLSSPYSQYLGQNCKAVLMQLEDFGDVESIVRNELTVHEKIGQYNNLKLGEKMGLAINVGGLDLRFFMMQWAHVLAIKDDSKVDSSANSANEQQAISYSFQFFDKAGNAINKVFLRDINEHNIQKWHAIVDEQVAQLNDDKLHIAPSESKVYWQYKQLNAEDIKKLHTEWLAMKDVHQFHFLLNKLDIDRASSYQQAPQGLTTQLSNEAVAALLNAVETQSCPLMTFVGNTGIVQIQTGQVHNVRRMGEWINILDKKENNFTLHLKDSALAQVWSVKRHTKDGIVSCIEGIDEYGETMVTFFGQRMEGEPERQDWQNIVAEIEHSYSIS